MSVIRKALEAERSVSQNIVKWSSLGLSYCVLISHTSSCNLTEERMAREEPTNLAESSEIISHVFGPFKPADGPQYARHISVLTYI